MASRLIKGPLVRSPVSGVLGPDGLPWDRDEGGSASRPLLDFRSGSFSRASSAWRVSDDGSTVTESASGVIRSPAPGRYVVEGAIENQTVRSESLGTTWVLGGASPTLSEDHAAAPDGAVTADQVGYAAASNSRLQQSLTVARWPLNSQIVATLFHKRGDAGSDDFIHRLDLSDGTNAQQVVTPSAVWQRDTLDATQAATDTASERHRIQNASGNAHDVLTWGVMSQHNAKYIRTSYVQTPASSTATKAADNLSFPVASLPAGVRDTTGFWFKVWPYFSSADHISYSIPQSFLSFPGHLANDLRIIGTGSSDVRYGASGGTADKTGLTWSERQELTIVVDHSAAQVRFGGFTTGDGNLDVSVPGDWSDSTTGNLAVGYWLLAGTFPYYGEISDLYPLATAPI